MKKHTLIFLLMGGLVLPLRAAISIGEEAKTIITPKDSLDQSFIPNNPLTNNSADASL